MSKYNDISDTENDNKAQLKKLYSQTEDDDMGPSISMAKEAENNEDFEKSTFNLKRTRSMGLLDEYIDPTKKLLEQSKTKQDNINSGTKNSQNSRYKENRNIAYSSDSDSNSNSGSTYSSSSSYSDSASDSSSGSDSYYSDESLSDDNEGDQHMNSTSVSPPSVNNDDILIPQDDNDVVIEPERHVDYLSHNWDESEISNSWKYIILKKKKRDIDLVNAARLENASWRTWAKTRNHLKTVSPEAVNWSKDSDVTWLYGPIVRDSPMDAQEAEDTNDTYNARGYGSDDEASKMLPVINPSKSTKPSKTSKSKAKSNDKKTLLKPILKKRTVPEIIEENSQWRLNEARKHYNEIKNTASNMDPNTNFHDYDYLAAKVNAQYFQKQKDNKSENNGRTMPHDTVNDRNNPLTLVPSNEVNEYNDNDISKKSLFKTGDDQTTSSILTNKAKQNANSASKPKRHIHFNDRVEQCMVVKIPSSDESLSDYESSDNEDNENASSVNARDSSKNIQLQRNTSRTSFLLESDDSDTSSALNSDSESNDEGNGDGLFISARYARRSGSITHSPVSSETSSISSKSEGRKHKIRPIIKLMPATTLNYGSDEESDNSDYSSYGNAVSHNVNTQRGYDYIYDYNSVYTGDTSNFLPIDNCDIVDVPDGINLQTSIADSNKNNYNFDQSATPLNLGTTQKNDPTVLQDSNKNTNTSSNDSFSSDDQYSLSSNTDDDEFIEDSNYQSSDEDDGYSSSSGNNIEPTTDSTTPGLKRTVSLGKSTDSLKNLSHVEMGRSTAISSQNFITGENIASNLKDTNPIRSNSRPDISLRSSSRSFIFDSDSEDSDDSDIGKPLVKSPVLTSPIVDSNSRTTTHKLTPPSRTPSSSFLSHNSDLNN
ncbi:similar to Saccharomyces cerevisiae YDR028C REG1 Regulatory subunit of type 1 protein phosphatase Glc7p [Maudiozyma saulgeensis]|uniref:Similar to Saccharomyces cerevisiae YDR028C REG1 Regulatory subunit of type 1 protein phosphatase Glc7p n=1 Tax=Maudiozyma saulgeensis TaxID=1789683 RepID=A0A1X7R4B8_9SACH|nr:similar to Saccharomyces cerevisiae YDR028C REG1 Regulatory subunit of type 1 protein phosphatase Glc7p [Kazachstania saulgeensis]